MSATLRRLLRGMAGVLGLGVATTPPLVMSRLPHFLHKVNLFFFKTPMAMLRDHFQKPHSNKNITSFTLH
jgi:hypothetical protein